MASKYIKPSEQIRRAVKRCGVTRYRISKETGIDQATLTRFMSGERGLPMRTLDVLGEYLRLRIDMEGPRRYRRGQKGE